MAATTAGRWRSDVRQAYANMFEKELSVVDMFQYPTISAIAEYLSKDTTSEPERNVRDRIQDRASKRRAALEERMNRS